MALQSVQIRGSLVLKNTFFETVDEAAARRRRGSRRSKSLGDEPQSDSEPCCPASPVRQGNLKAAESACWADAASPCKRNLDLFSHLNAPAETIASEDDFDSADELVNAHFELASPTKPAELDDGSEIASLTTVQAVLDRLASAPSTAALKVFAFYTLARLCDSDDAARLPWLREQRTFQALVASMHGLVSDLDQPRQLMRVMWASAKLSVEGNDVELIVKGVARSALPILGHFGVQDLSNTLWALAKITAGDGEASCPRRRIPEVQELGRAIVVEATQRLDRITDQCLSNCLWATVKLDLRDRAAQDFACGCIQRLQGHSLQRLSSQGLANSAWAGAKMWLDESIRKPFVMALAAQALKTPGGLASFMPQELSMTLWAVAKVTGRGGQRKGGSKGTSQAQIFAEAVAVEATRRLSELSPQSISNIAWALGTLELVRKESSPARSFMLAVAAMFAGSLVAFSPQAISNIIWALSRVRNAPEALQTFGRAAAAQAADIHRSHEFAWQDSASIVLALMHCQLRDDAVVRNFAQCLIISARSAAHDIGTQALLNITVAATRLDVDPTELYYYVEAVEATLARRTLQDIDRRQLMQIRASCKAIFRW